MYVPSHLSLKQVHIHVSSMETLIVLELVIHSSPIQNLGV